MNAIISVVVPILCLLITKQDTHFSILAGFFAFMFASIVSYGATNIADIIKWTCKPDVIFYRKTTELLGQRLWWSFGINIVFAMVAGYVSIIIFNIYRVSIWRSFLLFVVLALITAATTWLRGVTFNHINNNIQE